MQDRRQVSDLVRGNGSVSKSTRAPDRNLETREWDVLFLCKAGGGGLERHDFAAGFVHARWTVKEWDLSSLSANRLGQRPIIGKEPFRAWKPICRQVRASDKS
jgi:hypothetical protein